MLITLLKFDWPLAGELGPVLQDEGVLSPDTDSFYDKNIDYQKFVGRITDKDWTHHILKIQTETSNVKFLRSGDPITFVIHQHEDERPCEGYAQNSEKEYVVIFVKNLEECWSKALGDQGGQGSPGQLRRGTQITLTSPRLSKRIIEASQYRRVLLQTKKDFLNQLKGVNQDLWTFHQRKVLVAAQFDKEILEIRKQKQKALDELLEVREEKLVLQKELAQKLNEIDDSLNFYRVDRQENLFDRWHMDQDLGIPVYKRPPALEKKEIATVQPHQEE